MNPAMHQDVVATLDLIASQGPKNPRVGLCWHVHQVTSQYKVDGYLYCKEIFLALDLRPYDPLKEQGYSCYENPSTLWKGEADKARRKLASQMARYIESRYLS